MVSKREIQELATQLRSPFSAIAIALVWLSIIPGDAAFVVACFLAGMLAGFPNRAPAILALALVVALQIVAWPQHFRLESFSAIIGVALAPLGPIVFRHRHGGRLTVALLLAFALILIAADRELFDRGFATVIPMASLAAGIGLALGTMMDATWRRQTAWSQANIALIARDLLLGRITTGMIHDLAQPINVVSMANGNLAYLLGNSIPHDNGQELLLERVGRIADQTDRAAHLLHNFRSFGRTDTTGGHVLTVRDALERSRIATTSNVRHGGVDVAFEGDALDCIGGDHLDILQMAVAGTLLCAFAGYTDPDGERRNGTIIVEARLAGPEIEMTFAAFDEHRSMIAIALPDPVLAWLLEEILKQAGGSYRKAEGASGCTTISLKLPREA